MEPKSTTESLLVNVGQLVHEWAGKLSRSSWQKEQSADPEIGPIVELLKSSKLLQFKTPHDSPPPPYENFVTFCNDLRLEDELLY